MSAAPEFQQLARALRRQRVHLGYTQAQVAEMIHVDTSYITRLETFRDTPSFNILSVWARALEYRVGLIAAP